MQAGLRIGYGRSRRRPAGSARFGAAPVVVREYGKGQHAGTFEPATPLLRTFELHLIFNMRNSELIVGNRQYAGGFNQVVRMFSLEERTFGHIFRDILPVITPEHHGTSHFYLRTRLCGDCLDFPQSVRFKIFFSLRLGPATARTRPPRG